MRLGLALLLGLAALPATAAEKFVLAPPPEASLEVRRDIAYRQVGELALRFDLYRPAREQRALPVVIFLNGIGASWMRGHVQYQGWARATAAAGLAGITLDTREATVPEDFDTLVAYLRAHAAELHVDASRIVVWACSSNVRAGLPLVEDPRRTFIQGAVFYYGAAPVERFRLDVPLLVVRAGLDATELNRHLGEVVAGAMAANVALTVINDPAGHHGFDIVDDTERSRQIVRQTIDFMKASVDPTERAERLGGQAEAEAAARVYAQDWPAAHAGYEALVARRPEDPALREKLGEVLLALGEPRRAVTEYERALTLGTNNRGLDTMAIVTAYARLGETEMAIGWLEKMGPILRFFAARLRQDPLFAKLRADPRVVRLLAAVP
jgi:tetratricopeptide (TPR) repeat protein